MRSAVKPLVWMGDSRDLVRKFPVHARQDAGFQLWRVQCGNEPDDWKPISNIGAGVKELRIHTTTEHRVVYIAKFPEAVYVLHAFEKRTRRTPKRHL
jgi:phage-related protein